MILIPAKVTHLIRDQKQTHSDEKQFEKIAFETSTGELKASFTAQLNEQQKRYEEEVIALRKEVDHLN